MLTPFSLRGDRVALEPLRPDHAPALAAAAAEDRSAYGFTWVPDGLGSAESYVQSALTQQEDGHAVPHAILRRHDGVVVGTTRVWALQRFDQNASWPPGSGQGGPIDEEHPPSVGEIGSTWLSASAQGTGINTEVKLLQLTHAFDVWGMVRVTLKTDARNNRSRAALEHLGASFEGVRRAHALATDGTVRDSAYYSILASEWPEVRDLLRRRLAGHR